MRGAGSDLVGADDQLFIFARVQHHLVSGLSVGGQVEKTPKLVLSANQENALSNRNLHHLRGPPAHGLGRRDQSLGPARVPGVELFDGGRALNKTNMFFFLDGETCCFKDSPRTTPLTLPPSTISFCNSVEARTSMRIAYNTGCKRQHTLSMTTKKRPVKGRQSQAYLHEVCATVEDPERKKVDAMIRHQCCDECRHSKY